MRISDWSSDMCSSDLTERETVYPSWQATRRGIGPIHSSGCISRQRTPSDQARPNPSRRSGERRAAKEGVCTCRYRLSLYQENTTHQHVPMNTTYIRQLKLILIILPYYINRKTL